MGGVAQLGEHLLCKQGVVGSSPITSTTISGLGDWGMRCSGEYRGEAKEIGIDDSLRNCDAGGVSKWRRRSRVKTRGQVFVRVNQVLVRLWALPSQSLTGRFGVPAMAMVFRGDCCVLSKSDFCDEQGRLCGR